LKTVNYICYNEQTGYGVAAVGLIKALQEEEINIEKTLIMPGHVEGGGILVKEEYRSAADAVIIHTVPEYYPYWVKKRAQDQPHVPIWGYTAWETNQIPPHWTDLLNGMHGVFVPSRWNKEVLQACGVKVPIVVLPHVSEFQGEIPEIPPSKPLANAWEQTAGNYVFYCIGMWNERKNMPVLIQAFLEAFQPEEKVSLFLKTDHRDWTTYRPQWSKLFLRSSFGSSEKSLRKLVGAHPNRNKVIHVTDGLPATDLAWIHQKGNCFVSCTHGEGWGMGAYEAAWYGNAVAITAYGGQLDYLSTDDAYLMPFTPGAVNTVFGKASYAKGQKWADVAMSEVRNTLRAIYCDQTQSNAKGSLLKKKVSQTFANKKIANTCIEVLFRD